MYDKEAVAVSKPAKNIFFIFSVIFAMICGCGCASGTGADNRTGTGLLWSAALTCEGLEYEEKSDEGYLTFSIDSSGVQVVKTIKVDGFAIEKGIASVDPREIKGVLVLSEITEQLVEEEHLEGADAEELFYDPDNKYDKYFLIGDYSTK